MLGDRQRNVGFLVGNVGSMSGFFGKPDITFGNRINGLDAKCREWQVFLAGERCHEFGKVVNLAQEPPKPLTLLDLNDVAT